MTNPIDGLRDGTLRVVPVSGGDMTPAELARRIEAGEQWLPAPDYTTDLLRALRDAERYRWLRVRWGRIDETYIGDTDRMAAIGHDPSGWVVDPETLDAAIDTAMQRGGDE